MVTEAGLARLDEVLPGHLDLIQQWFVGQLTPDQLDQLLAPDEGGVIEYVCAQVAPNGDVVVMWDNENAALQVRVMTTP